MKQKIKITISALELALSVIAMLVVWILSMCFMSNPLWTPILVILLAVFLLSTYAFRQLIKSHQPTPEEQRILEELMRRRFAKRNRLSRNGAVALGSAVVSTAVFGVPPKTSVPVESPPNGGSLPSVELAGGRSEQIMERTLARGPARATETVALPISTASLTKNST
jgi:hypothetical protein